MLLTKTKIKEIVQDTAMIGVVLVVLVVISYDSFIQKRSMYVHRKRPIDF